MTQRLLTLIFVTSILGTAGCATTNSLLRDATTGAIIGAVTGAVIGASNELVYDVYSSYPYRTDYYTVRYPYCPRVNPTRVYTRHGVVWVYPPTDPRCRNSFVWYEQFRRHRR